ncbi:MAG: hypothetical protein PHU77_14520 [Simplicispira sp.]|nr:hypothetical protein [Simplicispira sp.]
MSAIYFVIACPVVPVLRTENGQEKSAGIASAYKKDAPRWVL